MWRMVTPATFHMNQRIAAPVASRSNHSVPRLTLHVLSCKPHVNCPNRTSRDVNVGGVDEDTRSCCVAVYECQRKIEPPRINDGCGLAEVREDFDSTVKAPGSIKLTTDHSGTGAPNYGTLTGTGERC